MRRGAGGTPGKSEFLRSLGTEDEAKHADTPVRLGVGVIGPGGQVEPRHDLGIVTR